MKSISITTGVLGLVIGYFIEDAAGPLLAAEQAVLTPRLVARLKTVTEAQMAPDGRRTAFLVSVPREPGKDEDGEPYVEMWMAGETDKEPRPFITGKVQVERPAWSADSKHVYFLSKRGADKFKALYRIAVAGGEATRVLALGADIADFTLGPDDQIGLVATDAADPAVKAAQDKGFRQEIYEEDWRMAKLWVAKPLVKDPPKPAALALEGTVRAARWNPVDSRVALVTSPTPSVDDGMMRQQIRIVNATNVASSVTVAHAGKLGALSWSPDGKRIAFIGAEDMHDPSAGRLKIADAKTGEARDILPGFAGEVIQAQWIDDSKVRFLAAMGVHTLVQEIDVSRSGAEPKTVLTLDGPVYTGFSHSTETGAIALVGSTPLHPAELFLAEGAEHKLRRVSDNNPWLAKLRLARQEVIRHKARDGLELEGVLMRPLDETAGSRYPLILAVHGGPEAHISHGWLTSYSNPGQVAAARGFAVFYPNYRGSTGRGVAFSKLGQGDAAGKEFDDLVDAVDHLVSLGLVDTKKVGVTGGSYGGYATAWCSTRYSDRFAAGVMFVGISDKLSKVGTTDIPDEEFYVHARKRPWEDWQFLLERSPIYHAAKGVTPLLILHGKDDPRVHPGQSREMFRHLKMHGKAPTRLVFYPGEGHGNRKAAARLDYSLRLLQWMEHYLMGPGGSLPATQLDYATAGVEAKP